MKKDNQIRRSKLFIIGLLICGLLGLLVINTDPVSAEKKGLAKANPEMAVVDYEQTPEEALAGSVSVMPSLLKLGSAMVLVIGLIYGLLFLLKKMMGKKYSGNGQGKLLEVLETTYLTPKNTVSLIRVADKAVLVGSTEGSITALGELDEIKTKELLDHLETEATPDPIQNIFNAASNKFRKLTSKTDQKDLVDSQV